jgi:DNA adenine methylase
MKIGTRTLPHPFPYQGSKRNLAAEILGFFPHDVRVLYEPFAGSAAITIAASANHFAERFLINDLNKSLMDLWEQIIKYPEKVSMEYSRLWHEQLENPKLYYLQVRDEFNKTGQPELLLYLLARCVKASVRFNSRGEFNQSADNRRKGMKPETMRFQITGASHLLKDWIETTSADYREILQMPTSHDLVYMDPPYLGVCGNRDPRYKEGIDIASFIQALDVLNQRGIRYLVSYDGRTGDKVYGEFLPIELNLTRIEINAGRSSQATLLGRKDVTIESLYLSPALTNQLSRVSNVRRLEKKEQLHFLG